VLFDVLVVQLISKVTHKRNLLGQKEHFTLVSHAEGVVHSSAIKEVVVANDQMRHYTAGLVPLSNPDERENW
jgi:hypothetical protein